MGEQLAIPVEVVNPDNFAAAKEEYDIKIKLKDLHPVFLVFNKHPERDPKGKATHYYVSCFASREGIESYPNFKIIE